MNKLIAGHRALFGIVGVAALAALFASLACPTVPTWAEVALAGLAAFGIYAIFRSPYWSIVYRESPLRRAVTGRSDLDERELALRDRASGLTYYLFATINLILVAALGWLDGLLRGALLDPDVLRAAVIPYAYFALTLPVIMLEWFEPSHLWAAPVDEEEAA